ncbi:histone deacetylase complex subunit SAP18 isoform X1 [Canis lupus baileyi]|uniref:histone deacetylase complex subunit SAP18 isoform X1 n=1 Tax=Canis lupus dingo TaxID=286419 RepID=UPI0006B3D8DE|nr:histone deacetylase complex subunit SAP18 isoform X1 [Canis lupus dingo]XP_038290509.1 histone deacetylase complex subunit SAP18 isoform X1 [Canis lupus familiaris]|eukprot:XP_013962811.1 histone deacetylase complex subunit SAP18 isoform X1 [Canis lupus familiaris]
MPRRLVCPANNWRSLPQPPNTHSDTIPQKPRPADANARLFPEDATRRRGRARAHAPHNELRLRQQTPRPSSPVLYKASSFSSRETPFSCSLRGSEVRASVSRAVGGRWRWSRALPRRKLRRSRRNRSIGRKYGIRREVETCPLLLRVFTTNNGRHHRMDEFSRGNVPSSELQIYTWMDATLKELTSLVKEVYPEARKKGTHFNFAIVFTDPKRPGYRVKEIGSTMSGRKGTDDSMTLQSQKFQIGDYLDIAITPPNRAPPPSGRMRPY